MNTENSGQVSNANASETKPETGTESQASKPAKAPRKPETLNIALLAWLTDQASKRLGKLKTPKFTEPEREKGESLVSYAARVISADRDYKAKHGDEKSALRTVLNDLFRDAMAKFELGSLHTKGVTGTRNTYTPEQKAKAIEAMRVPSGQPGYKPVSALALEMGISAPTLNLWKKEAGLVKARE